jgi:hypothetical protein
MVLLPTINKERYEQNVAFYKKQNVLSLSIFILVQALLIALAIFGFTIWPRITAGFAITHFIIFLFIFLHNFRLVMDIRYFGIKESFSLGALLFHILILLAIEACAVFTSFVFLDVAPSWIGASGLAVSMAVVLLLIIERKTYTDVRLHIDFDRGLYKDNIVKFK